MNLSVALHSISLIVIWAEISPVVWKEVGIAVAMLTTLIGVVVCWRAPRSRMSVEERAKDGKLSAEEARRRIRRQEWAGPVVVLIGFVALAIIVLR